MNKLRSKVTPATVGGVHSPDPDVELGQVTCFGQWDISGHHGNGGLECASVVSLGSSSLPFPWECAPV